MLNLVKLIDKAGGYVFGIKNQDNMASMMSCAAGADFEYFMYPFMAASFVDCLIPCSQSNNQSNQSINQSRSQ